MTFLPDPRSSFPGYGTDCHCHFFGPTDRYPLIPDRKYEPDPAPLDAYLRIAGDLGLRRMVLVQPTPYGFDNRCLLDTLGILGNARGRGVVSLDSCEKEDEMHAMTEMGVRAARLNFVHGASRPSRRAIIELAAKIAPHGWHIEVFAPNSFLSDILDDCKGLPVDIVLDHMGSLPPCDNQNNSAFRNISKLLDSGRGWVKLCGYRASRHGPPYDDIGANARALIARHADRCVWGTDWPHGNVSPRPETADLMELLLKWTDHDEAVLQRILSENPSKLYDFPVEICRSVGRPRNP